MDFRTAQVDEMIAAIKKALIVCREQIAYLFFGVLTTIINYGVFWLLTELWDGHYVLVANLITFVAATAFAYLTNKRFVFCSSRWDFAFVLRESAAFTAARLFSFAIEEVGLYVSTYMLELGRYTLWHINGVMLAKIVLSILAVVLNYFFSKFWVFTKRRE